MGPVCAPQRSVGVARSSSWSQNNQMLLKYVASIQLFYFSRLSRSLPDSESYMPSVFNMDDSTSVHPSCLFSQDFHIRCGLSQMFVFLLKSHWITPVSLRVCVCGFATAVTTNSRCLVSCSARVVHCARSKKFVLICVLSKLLY